MKLDLEDPSLYLLDKLDEILPVQYYMVFT